MTDAASELHKALREGQQKLTYFLLGAETAVFAYLGKDFVAEPFGLTRNTFEFFGLLAFAASIAAGILAVSAHMYVQKLNVVHLALNDEIREHRKAAEGGEPHVNFLTGETQSGAALMQQAERMIRDYQEAEQHMSEAGRKTEQIAMVRSALLILGLVLLVASRSIGLFR